MTRPLLYVAATYGDPSPIIRRWHTERAALLGRLAQACGYAPIVVHTSIEAGVYGDDGDADQRAAGMASTLAICDAVARSQSSAVWALLRDDDTASEGTTNEATIAVSARTLLIIKAWRAWGHVASGRAAHLLTEWDRLAVRPDSIGEWRDIADTFAVRNYACGYNAAMVAEDGWCASSVDGASLAEGPEAGSAGRAAADAALHAAGLLD